MSNAVRKLRGSASPLKLILTPLLLTIFLGMVVNGANAYTNGIPASTNFPNGVQHRWANVTFDCAKLPNGTFYSNSTGIMNCTRFDLSLILNPNSPFTDLVHSNFLGFVNGFFKVNNTITGFAPVNNASAAEPIWIASCVTSAENPVWALPGSSLNPLINIPYTSTDSFLKHSFVLECSPPPKYTGTYSVSGTPGTLWFFCAPNFVDVTTCSHMPLMTNQNINQILHLQANITLTDYTCSSFNSSTKVSGLTPLWSTGSFPNPRTDNMICGQEGTSSVSVNNYANAFFGIIETMLGSAMIFMSLGLRVGAFTGLIGSNSQGTRLAQSFGFGLLLWGMMTSEFGTALWVALPFGFGTILNLIETGVFFLGLWERSLSWR